MTCINLTIACIPDFDQLLMEAAMVLLLSFIGALTNEVLFLRK